MIFYLFLQIESDGYCLVFTFPYVQLRIVIIAYSSGRTWNSSGASLLGSAI